MNFRDRGQGIQIVRSTVDPETKKSKETLFAIVPKRTLEIDPAVLEKASAAEQAEIKAWLERYRQIQNTKAQAETYSLPDVVRTAVRYLEGVTDATERDMLRDLMLDASKRLRRAARGEEEAAPAATGSTATSEPTASGRSGRGAGKKAA